MSETESKRGERPAIPEREGRLWLRRLARVGYAGKGVVYGLVGVVALQAALSGGGRAVGTRGALTIIEGGPVRDAVLLVMTAGLLGFAAWRVLAGILDTEEVGTGLRGVAKRAQYIASGLAYGGIAFYAARLLLLGGVNQSASSEQQADTWTSRFLSLPLGQVLVGGAGAAAIAAGIAICYAAIRAKFQEKLDLSGERPWVRSAALRTGQAGIAARGLVVVLVGVYLGKAALEFDPQEARGLEGSLESLSAGRAGSWPLAAVSAGFIAYGLYSVIQARYRRIDLR